jgi:hypothetical protein
MAAKLFVKPLGGLDQERAEADPAWLEGRTKVAVPVEIRGTREEIKAFLFQHHLKFFTSSTRSALYYRLQQHTPVTKKYYKPVKVGTGGTALAGLVLRIGMAIKEQISGVTMELEISDRSATGWTGPSEGDLSFSELIKGI